MVDQSLKETSRWLARIHCLIEPERFVEGDGNRFIGNMQRKSLSTFERLLQCEKVDSKSGTEYLSFCFVTVGSHLENDSVPFAIHSPAQQLQKFFGLVVV